uniref:NADH-ubiquinone oxidoreductase chain 5 n=1 Tax=Lyreidus brevifrons TaxID=1617980 RepID=A0A0D3QU06_LYRBR|nr:NADH dehydrogenase subunit 5 [Lyreidus brevifrons]AJR19296.1 NADH dehydrogenase subunit 5 [Lyreidus brevifrons]
MNWKMSMHIICMTFLSMGSILSGFMSLWSMYKGVSSVIEWEILNLSSSCIVYVMIFDWISLLFLSFVLLISSMVLFYSGGYMMGDLNFNRFMYLVVAFVASMGAMILSPNLISILLGWDGLGLVSYALVIYYQNEKSSNAGMLTVLSNRVGDVAILLGVGLMIKLGGWNFMYYSFYLEDMNSLLLKCLFVLAAMTKSAQIPFSAWLPAAMAAPTPVSALVHSSPPVTAGVYMMIRFSPALENSCVQSVLLIISCLTMFMAGLGANFEYDLKKIIALSTLSQLGVMLSVLSLGFSDLAFFHLLTHALFKALLFMCAGVVIHSVSEYQDIRCMGSLVKFMPLSVMYMSVANLALCGAPFMAGFYSKDLILEMAFMSWINLVSFFLYVFATGLTVCYTLRLIYYSISGGFNLSSLNNVSDSSSLMTTPMSSLGIGAIIGGACLSWLMFPDPYMICMSSFMKLLVILVSLLGGVSGYLLNMMTLNYSLKSLSYYSIVVMMGSMWFMPLLSTLKLGKYSLNLGGQVYKVGDKGWSEHFGGQGLNSLFSSMFNMLYVFQGSGVKVFMKMFILSSFVMMLILM